MKAFTFQKLTFTLLAVGLLVFGFFAWQTIGNTTIGVSLRVNPVLEQGLVAYWNFDSGTVSGSTVIDASGNGRNGFVTATTTLKVFTSIGTSTYQIPDGISAIHVKVWGAGGGGGGAGAAANPGGGGGAGGFVGGVVEVTPGQSLTVVVGEGGKGGTGSATLSGGGGGGGGYTLVGLNGNNFYTASNTILFIAGAGGGGAGGEDNQGNATFDGGDGGPGGGTSGSAGTTFGAAEAGGGGTQTAGGTANTAGDDDGPGTAGRDLAGGAGGGATSAGAAGGAGGANGGGAGAMSRTAGSDAGGGGGGGAGYQGGGGGGSEEATNDSAAGGGGGSSFATSTATGVSNVAGTSTTTPANKTDPDYVSGVGAGGLEGGGDGGSGGNGGNGLVVINATTTVITLGRIGQGLDLDGTSNTMKVTAGDGSVFDPGSSKFSLAVWFKTSSTTGTMISAGKDPSSLSEGYSIQIANGLVSFSFDNGDSLSIGQATSSQSYADNVWHHVVGVRTGDRTADLYIDGVLVAQDTDTSGSLAGTDIDSDLFIGKKANGGGYFDGSIDDVRFYNRQLTASEVSRLYHLGATTQVGVTLDTNPALAGDLAAHWTFDASTVSSTTVTDISGNGKTGMFRMLSQTQTYSTAGSQNYTVPAGVESVTVKLWGAGGAGGRAGSTAAGGNGGGAGAVTCTLAVSPGEKLSVDVGAGGTGATSNGYGGGGGGYSSVTRSGTKLAQAGGGGGGGGGGGSSNTGGDGGVGGNTGGNGSSGNGGSNGGGGGTDTAGGAGGTGSTGTDGQGGSADTGGGGGNGAGGTGGDGAGGSPGGGNGGTSGSNTLGGGGGGGGRYGGGGGEAGGGSTQAGAGGGGGSSFCSGSSVTEYDGSGRTAGNTSDPNYAGNAGQGSLGTASGGTVSAGNNGRVVIITDASTLNVAIGRLGQAVSFDGMVDNLYVGTVGSGVKTIAFWMKTSTTTANMKVIDIDGTDQIELNASGYVSPTSFSTNAVVYKNGGTSSSTAIAAGEWTHIVITDSTGVNASKFVIGAATSTATTNQFFGGAIDDVRLYTKVLSAEEIKRLYHLGATTQVGVTLDANPNIKRGLVGHWTFDGPKMYQNVSDSSGNGKTGYISGQSTGTTTMPGRIGQALEFDGTDDVVTVSRGSPIDNIFTGGGTVAAWIYPKGAGGNSLGRVAAKGGTGYWYVATNDVSSGLTRIVLEQGFTGGAGWGSWRTSYVVPLNQWTHVAVVYNKDSTSNDPVIYINGTAQTIDELQDPVGGTAGTDADGDFYIGNTAGATRTFDGRIDDLRLYDRSLSASEIQHLYGLGR